MTSCDAGTVSADALGHNESWQITESVKCEDTHRKHFWHGTLLACGVYVTMKGSPMSSSVLTPKTSALVLIDMQNGFVEPDGGLCVAGAKATLPACVQALEAARRQGIPVIHVHRHYALGGHDVEPGRREVWRAAGKPLSDARPDTLEPCPGLEALPGETIIVKPSWSAFDRTNLEETLRDLGVTCLILTGTTTPNCIRSTCYDAMAHGFEVAVLADATSSRSAEVQQANLEDMAAVGARIMSTDELAALSEPLLVRPYTAFDVPAMADIWNQVVEDGIAFPQDECLNAEDAAGFFAQQTHCGVACIPQTGEVVGMYILHPNNVGRCGHICNTSYAVSRKARGRHVGEALVRDSLTQGKAHGFRILQFNAVVATNAVARHLYEKLGFTQLGVIPGGFRMPNDTYEDIVPYYHEL